MVIKAIILVYLSFITFNVTLRLLELWSYEKNRVRQGSPALSNFEYYHILVPYVVTSSILIILSIFNSLLYQPTTVWGLLLTVVIFLIGYAITNVIISFIISIVQARVARKKRKELKRKELKDEN